MGSTVVEAEALTDVQRIVTFHPNTEQYEAFSRSNLPYVCTMRFWHLHAFFVGSILEVIACIIDLVVTLNERQSNDDDDDDGPTKLPLQYWDVSKALSVASTLLYLIDSILHYMQQRHEEDENQNDLSGQVNYRTRMRFVITFGIAACFDLAASIMDDEDYPWPSYISECAAVYLFWSSAVLLLYTKRAVYCNGNNFKSASLAFWLLCLGDWLYWMGCTADVTLNIVDNPRHDINYLWAASIALISSLFWFLDAVMYQLADADVFDVVVPLGHADVDGGIMPLAQDENDDEEE